VIAAVLQALLLWVLPKILADSGMYLMMGWAGLVPVILVWWLFFSRAPWIDRIAGLVAIAGAIAAGRLFAHFSIVGAGMGWLIYILPLPMLTIGLVAWAVITQRASAPTRRALLPVVVAIPIVPFLIVRTDGVWGGSGSINQWRWTPTAEARLLAKGNDDPKPLPDVAPPIEAPIAKADEKAPGTALGTPAPAPTPAPGTQHRAPTSAGASAEQSEAEWPGFRGANRDSVVRDLRIKTDWSASPPVELWRRAVGPGWSSFAVHGDFIFTQEQRGDDELVSCYRLSTGEPVWRHRDAARFYESNGGPGPRGTPTLHDGRVYTLGATAILNALDERTGKVLWSHKFAEDHKVATPIWGFSASPIVVDDLVIVNASGAIGAFDRINGQQRWFNPSRGGTYSSPHLATIDGVPQVLLMAGPGLMSFSPADGKLLWEHAWEDGGGITQPAVLDNGDVVINKTSMTGGVVTRRLSAKHSGGAWSVEERWTSNGLKPYFNDFVIHKGHAYGFDNSILASINLENGQRNWKGGRYGNGQMILLPDQDLLLLVSEEGEVALVNATTDKYTEVAKAPALNAKTWNHPVLVGDTLLVRNGEEMVAFKLALERPHPTER
jgi:outer membrane protein assembly factor BamB